MRALPNKSGKSTQKAQKSSFLCFLWYSFVPFVVGSVLVWQEEAAYDHTKWGSLLPISARFHWGALAPLLCFQPEVMTQVGQDHAGGSKEILCADIAEPKFSPN